MRASVLASSFADDLAGVSVVAECNEFRMPQPILGVHSRNSIHARGDRYPRQRLDVTVARCQAALEANGASRARCLSIRGWRLRFRWPLFLLDVLLLPPAR